MARKHNDDESGQVPEHTHEFEHHHRSGWGRRLAVLLALVGGVAYVVKRNQRRADLDEGVWHEAPSS